MSKGWFKRVSFIISHFLVSPNPRTLQLTKLKDKKFLLMMKQDKLPITGVKHHTGKEKKEKEKPTHLLGVKHIVQGND
jgi:hypothetical protein